MARSFVRASSQFLNYAGGVVTGEPCTMACFFNSGDVSVTQTVMSVADSTTSSRLDMYLATSVSINARTVNTVGGNNTATTSVGCSASTDYHGCAIFQSATDRRIFLNGANKATATVNRVISTMNSTDIGRYGTSAPGQYFGGTIWEAAIWNVALTDAEVAALAAGACPLLIRPQSLVGYWPLFGNDSPEPDRWNGRKDMTVTGATKGAHGRMYYQQGRIFVPVPAVASVGKTPFTPWPQLAPIMAQ